MSVIETYLFSYFSGEFLFSNALKVKHTNAGNLMQNDEEKCIQNTFRGLLTLI